MIKRVIVESPYAGDVKTNESYLNDCLKDCLERGEAPFASHGLYTRKNVLDDTKPEERRKGIDAGFAWRNAADFTVIYVDHGVTNGMIEGARDCLKKDHTFLCRSLYGANVMTHFNKIMELARNE